MGMAVIICLKNQLNKLRPDDFPQSLLCVFNVHATGSTTTPTPTPTLRIRYTRWWLLLNEIDVYVELLSDVGALYLWTYLLALDATTIVGRFQSHSSQLRKPLWKQISTNISKFIFNFQTDRNDWLSHTHRRVESSRASAIWFIQMIRMVH